MALVEQTPAEQAATLGVKIKIQRQVPLKNLAGTAVLFYGSNQDIAKTGHWNTLAQDQCERYL